MPTNWEGLLPTAVAANVLTATQQASALLSVCRVEPMPTHVEALPLVSLAPRAAWLETPGERKPYSEIVWSAEQLIARELALVTYVPDAVIQDSTWNVEASVEGELGGAIARALDLALLYGGANAPAGFPPNGIVTTPVTGADALEAIDKALSVVEASGVQPTAIVAGPEIGSALRQAYRAALQVPSVEPVLSLYGLPVMIAPNWDATKGDCVVGAFENLVVGTRSDISVQTSTDGTLTSEDQVIVSAFEADCTLIRCHARFAAAVGKPASPKGEGFIVPFATAKWSPEVEGGSARTPAAPTPAASAKSARSGGSSS